MIETKNKKLKQQNLRPIKGTCIVLTFSEENRDINISVLMWLA